MKEGDTVIYLQMKINKLTLKFSPERFIVHKGKGTRIVAKSQNNIITRNVSHIKKFRQRKIVAMKIRRSVTMRVKIENRLNKRIKLILYQEDHKEHGFQLQILDIQYLRF